MQTLVVDAGFQPVNLISGLEALLMVIAEKADVVSAYDQVVRSVSKTFKLPKIIRLKRIVQAIHKATNIAYSKYNVHARDQWECQYCSKKLTSKTATIDHIIPKSRGGENTWENTVTACARCNCKKDNKTPEEANLRLLRTPKKPRIMSMLKSETKLHMDMILKDLV